MGSRYFAAVRACGIVMHLAIVFVAYCFAGHIAFGAAVEEFSSIHDSAATLFSAKLGEFDFYVWTKSNSVLVPLYFLTYVDGAAASCAYSFNKTSFRFKLGLLKTYLLL